MALHNCNRVNKYWVSAVIVKVNTPKLKVIVKKWGDGGGRHWLVWIEWRPAGLSVSASVNLPSHHKVQKFSSGTGSPGWSWKKGRKTVVVEMVVVWVSAVCWVFAIFIFYVMRVQTKTDGI